MYGIKIIVVQHGYVTLSVQLRWAYVCCAVVIEQLLSKHFDNLLNNGVTFTMTYHRYNDVSDKYYHHTLGPNKCTYFKTCRSYVFATNLKNLLDT